MGVTGSFSDLTDTELYRRWERTLDREVARSLESEAEGRGFDLIEVARELRDEAITAARFMSELHPRGRDGRFIEKLGLVKLFDVDFRGKDGKSRRLNGDRGRVRDIRDLGQGKGPSIAVDLLDRNGRPTGETVNVKPRNIEQAPPAKARLDRPTGSSSAIDKLRELVHRVIPRGQRGEAGGKVPLSKRGMTEAEKERAAYLPRPHRTLEQERQDLLDRINPKFQALDTEDPEVRAQQLDDILGPMRWSILGTESIHDRRPGGEHGGWTAERSALHEEMYQDLVKEIEAAGIGKDHDALVLGGLPGAGKSSLLRPDGLVANEWGIVAWEPGDPVPEGATHVSINPDLIKEILIRRGMLPEGVDPAVKPREQVGFIHEESSYLSKQWVTRLADEGYNVVLDNTMDSPGATLKRMNPLARQGYSFRGMFADISVEESQASRKARYKRGWKDPLGGRFVSSSVTGNRGTHTGRLSKNRDAMDELSERDWFKDWIVVDNTGVTEGKPKGEITARGTNLGLESQWWTDGLAKEAHRPPRERRKRRPKRSHNPAPFTTRTVTAPTTPPPESFWGEGWATSGLEPTLGDMVGPGQTLGDLAGQATAP